MPLLYNERVILADVPTSMRTVELGDQELVVVPGGTTSYVGPTQLWIYSGSSVDTDDGVTTLKPNALSISDPGRYKMLNTYAPPIITQSTPSRSLNTSFQISVANNSFVTYSVSMVALLLAGANVFLEISPDNSAWQAISQVGVSLGLTVTITSSLYGFVPMGYYVRLRATGTATVTITNTQESLI